MLKQAWFQAKTCFELENFSGKTMLLKFQQSSVKTYWYEVKQNIGYILFDLDRWYHVNRRADVTHTYEPWGFCLGSTGLPIL